jgi:hypothetical protein
MGPGDNISTKSGKEFLQYVPLIGVALSFYSAVFATFVLYPWHLEISRELLNMQTMCNFTY